MPAVSREIADIWLIPLSVALEQSYCGGMVSELHQRRSLKYIRLAAHLAAQPEDVRRLEMTLDEVEEIVGEDLPEIARFPSWWRNDDRKAHSRAWLTAGWFIDQVDMSRGTIVLVRRSRP